MNHEKYFVKDKIVLSPILSCVLIHNFPRELTIKDDEDEFTQVLWLTV